MKYNSKNKFALFFKNGTFVESTGAGEATRHINIKSELDWINQHISEEIKKQGKTDEDISYFTISVSFSQKNDE